MTYTSLFRAYANPTNRWEDDFVILSEKRLKWLKYEAYGPPPPLSGQRLLRITDSIYRRPLTYIIDTDFSTRRIFAKNRNIGERMTYTSLFRAYANPTNRWEDDFVILSEKRLRWLKYEAYGNSKFTTTAFNIRQAHIANRKVQWMLGDELRCIAKQHAKICNEVERKQIKLWTNMNKKKDETINYIINENDYKIKNRKKKRSIKAGDDGDKTYLQNNTGKKETEPKSANNETVKIKSIDKPESWNNKNSFTPSPVSKIDKNINISNFSTHREQNKVADTSKIKNTYFSTFSDKEESELNFSTIKSKSCFNKDLKRPFSSAQDFLVFQYFDGKICSPLEKLYIDETNKHTDLIRYDKLHHGKSTVVLSTKKENKGQGLPSVKI